ncbi:MAG: DUF6146 family protein [Flavobacterium sp.]
MKTYIITFALVSIIIIGCSTSKTIPPASQAEAATVKGDTVRIANEELEYEIIIIDPGFTGWLARAQPRGYYEQSYFENKNRMWVYEWNNRFNQPQRYRGLYDMRIEYDPKINYGYEVNYMLYNYLVYFQNKTGQRLGGNVPAF